MWRAWQHLSPCAHIVWLSAPTAYTITPLYETSLIQRLLEWVVILLSICFLLNLFMGHRGSVTSNHYSHNTRVMHLQLYIYIYTHSLVTNRKHTHTTGSQPSVLCVQLIMFTVAEVDFYNVKTRRRNKHHGLWNKHKKGILLFEWVKVIIIKKIINWSV